MRHRGSPRRIGVMRDWKRLFVATFSGCHPHGLTTFMAPKVLQLRAKVLPRSRRIGRNCSLAAACLALSPFCGFGGVYPLDDGSLVAYQGVADFGGGDSEELSTQVDQ